jgi:radical SAM protein with 4Fe4S-binding SPASM domain
LSGGSLVRKSSYRDFSLKAHLGNSALGRPNSCQLELTYACGLRCSHCYLSGRNQPGHIRRELNTAKMKKIIDELRSAGVLWICLTGGDPLQRPDFSRLYQYAYKQGFLLTVFTNGYSLNKRNIALFKKYPPFSVEITLNAVEKGLYEKISGVKGSFKKTMAGIAALLRNKLPLKLKAMVTLLNAGHIKEIKKYARAHKLKLTLDSFLHAGLDGDIRPLKQRVPPEYFKRRDGRSLRAVEPRSSKAKHSLFPCVAAGGDGFQISPFGHISACCLIRKDEFKVLPLGLQKAFADMIKYFNKIDSKTRSECRDCLKREICGWCPGKALVETSSLNKPIDYCCQIAKAYAG